MKILAVDDIGYSRHNLMRVLERLGHEVVQADSGTAALTVLRKDHTIELVITDLIMDDFDGVELYARTMRLERVNDDGKAELPPFILLTSAQPGRPGASAAASGRIDLAKEIGFADVLYKPIDPQSIKDIFARLQSDSVEPPVQTAPLIQQLKEITQKLIQNKNVDEAGKLKHALEEHIRLLGQVAVPVGAA